MRLTSLFALVVISAIWSGAAAQTNGSVNIDSVRSPFSARVTYSLTLQTESVSPITGKLVANPGQVKKVGAIDLIKQTFILAEIPGPKTVGAKTSVASIKATWVVAGGVGWLGDPIVIHVTPLNIEVPAGYTLAIRYDMPVQSPGTTLALAPGSFAWLVGIGAKATDIPPPVIGPTSGGTITPPPVVVPPVVVPPVVPPPVPPTPPGTSPDGASIPPLAQLVDETGAVWTQVGTHPLRNGAEVDASGSILVTIKAGVIYFKQGDPVNFRWLRWAGNGWAVSAAP